MALAYRYLYPTRSRPELWADGVAHAVGVIWALGLLIMATTAGETVRSLVLTAMFATSAAYHLTPVEAYREYLRRADHAMIFVTIAAVPTPFIIDTTWALWIPILWSLCLLGAWFKIWIGKWHDWISQGTYVTIGMIAAFAIFSTSDPWPLFWGCAWLCTGLIVFNLCRLPFHMALWHMCVVGGLASLVA